MTWILLAAAAAVLILFSACWWGSNIVFHPPKMLPMEIWPDRFGLAYETVEFKTEDGLRLKGWLIPASKATDRTVMFCHGWGDNKGDLLRRVHFLGERFNLFGFDTRHHGESEGGFSTIGCLETRDVQAALRFLKERRPAWAANLGAYGLSMGAAVAIWAAASHPEIKAVALEAPFASFNEVVRQFSRNNFDLPYFPFTWLCLLLIRLRLGADPEPYSPIHHIDRIAPRPSFFIAGSEDKLMPLPAVRKVFQKAGEPKELWIVDGATHGKCGEADGPQYRRRLTDFFEKRLSG